MKLVRCTWQTSAILILVLMTCLVTGKHSKYDECEYKTLKTCNQEFKNTFTEVSSGPFAVYCKAFQAYGNCLANDNCEGRFIDMDRFMIFQHMAMDKTLGICPQHNYDALKAKAEGSKKYSSKVEKIDEIEGDDFKGCSEQIHRFCAKEFSENLEKMPRMCDGVSKFIECYTTERDPSCQAKITKDFRNILEKVANELITMFKEKPGVMPNC